MANTLSVRRAAADDLSAVAALYRDAVGRSGCTWNEQYPTLEDAAADLEAGGLYVFCRGGEVIGALSVVSENELDGLPFWTSAEKPHEIARVVIDRRMAGHGYAAVLVSSVLTILREEGCDAVHLLVSPGNPAAIRTYEKLGFRLAHSVFLYDNDFRAMEKRL